MNIPLILRTARYLQPKQVIWRVPCRGRFVLMERFPEAARIQTERKAQKLPALNFSSDRLRAVAKTVALLQEAVHAPFLEGIEEGRFTLLNRTIDFGGLDRVEWRRELGEKNNRLWRMTLAYMGYLVPLFARDPQKALPVAASLLTSMHAQNPWSAKGIFRDVWHPYTASHRVINLVTSLHLMEAGGIEDTSGAKQILIDEIRLGTQFVLQNLERDLQYNHLLKNYVCLAAVASACEDTRFVQAALRDVKGCVAHQFLSDGMHAERSPMYHILSTLDLHILRDSGALPPAAHKAISERLAKAYEAVPVTMHPDGQIANYNDCWQGEAPAPSQLVDARFLRPERPSVQILSEAGYVRIAQAGDSVVMDYGDCGPDDNPAHAHADFLSLELSIDGRRALVDPGVPTYSMGEWRDRSRSAAYHNGPAVIGEEPIEFWSSFRVGRRGRGYKLNLPDYEGDQLAFAGWHTGYENLGLRVARAIRLIPGHALLIADAWEGRVVHKLMSSFLIGDDWTPVGESEFVCRDTGQAVKFACLTGRVETTGPALYWLRFGLERKGHGLSVSPVPAGNRKVACICLQWGESTQNYSRACSDLTKSLLRGLDAVVPNHQQTDRTGCSGERV